MMVTFGGRTGSEVRGSARKASILWLMCCFSTWMVIAREFVVDKSLSCMLMFLPYSTFLSVCQFHNEWASKEDRMREMRDREHR